MNSILTQEGVHRNSNALSGMDNTPVGSEMVSLNPVDSSTKKMREERKKASLEMKDFIEKTHEPLAASSEETKSKRCGCTVS